MYQSIPLDKIRQKIDALDNNIHDLLLERADLIMSISEEKKKAGIQIVQPAREARMIRRLIERHRGPLPEETIVRIWRELVSSVSLLQTGLSVAVYTPSQTPEYWDMARDYFGSVLPMKRTQTPESALNMVRNGEITFAVLPYPDTSDKNPWWSLLFDSRKINEGLSIIQRLPYGQKEHFNFDRHPALVVANAGFGESGDDYSLIGIELQSEMPKDKLIEKIKKTGLEIGDVYRSSNQYIFDIHRYINTKDSIIETLQSSLGEEAKIHLLGGYPCPLIYHKE